MREMKLEWILGIQILFLSGITLGCHSGNMDSVSAQKYLLIIASCITHLLTSQCFEQACITICNMVKSMNLPKLELKKNKYKNILYVLVLTTALTMYYSKLLLLNEEFHMLWVACAAVRYLESKSRPATITYGEALACSFAEGFLFQVVPPGGKWLPRDSRSDTRRGVVAPSAVSAAAVAGGVPAVAVLPAQPRRVQQERRDVAAAGAVPGLVTVPGVAAGAVFPRSLYCPRSLDAFNKSGETWPRLEQCQSLPEIRRDVAGVRDRVYRNTVYKIRRHPADPHPVHVVCATPINTLWMVLQKRAVYTPIASADADEIAAAFLATLPAIVRHSAELRDKCHLVYYDDMNPNENLAEVLLAKIREIEPNYEDMDMGF